MGSVKEASPELTSKSKAKPLLSLFSDIETRYSYDGPLLSPKLRSGFWSRSDSSSPSLAFLQDELAGLTGCDCTMDYLAELLKEKKQLSAFPDVFQNIVRLVDEEIDRVRSALFQCHFTTEDIKLPDPEGEPIVVQEKVYIPQDDYPNYNFVGRILGPRGMTAKQLERDTGCKLMVRGRGSMRDRKKEETNRGKVNWEHLDEDLHVLIECEETPNRAYVKLQAAVDQIKKLLVPTPEGTDELKRRQLMELAIMNGTYRPFAKCSYQPPRPVNRNANLSPLRLTDDVFPPPPNSAGVRVYKSQGRDINTDHVRDKRSQSPNNFHKMIMKHYSFDATLASMGMAGDFQTHRSLPSTSGSPDSVHSGGSYRNDSSPKIHPPSAGGERL